MSDDFKTGWRPHRSGGATFTFVHADGDTRRRGRVFELYRKPYTSVWVLTENGNDCGGDEMSMLTIEQAKAWAEVKICAILQGEISLATQSLRELERFLQEPKE